MIAFIESAYKCASKPYMHVVFIAQEGKYGQMIKLV